jgi:hypothetical protein
MIDGKRGETTLTANRLLIAIPYGAASDRYWAETRPSCIIPGAEQGVHKPSRWLARDSPKFSLSRPRGNRKRCCREWLHNRHGAILITDSADGITDACRGWPVCRSPEVASGLNYLRI